MQLALTADLFLRPLREDDAAHIAYHANDSDLAANCGPHFPIPYGLADAKNFCASKTGLTAPFANLAIARSDGLVGTIGLVTDTISDPTTPYATLGYWVGRSEAGKGYASLALIAYANYAFTQWPHLARLEAFAFAHNIASQRVLEKAGFVFEARLPRRGYYHGKAVDDVLYSRLR